MVFATGLVVGFLIGLVAGAFLMILVNGIPRDEDELYSYIDQGNGAGGDHGREPGAH